MIGATDQLIASRVSRLESDYQLTVRIKLSTRIVASAVAALLVTPPCVLLPGSIIILTREFLHELRALGSSWMPTQPSHVTLVCTGLSVALAVDPAFSAWNNLSYSVEEVLGLRCKHSHIQS